MPEQPLLIRIPAQLPGRAGEAVMPELTEMSTPNLFSIRTAADYLLHTRLLSGSIADDLRQLGDAVTAGLETR